MKRIALMIALLALPVSAQTTAKMTHADLAKQMQATGFVLFNPSLPDGRKVEFWFNPTLCQWLPVVVDRPTGKVTGTSPSLVFGNSDPGVCIPPP